MKIIIFDLKLIMMFIQWKVTLRKVLFYKKNRIFSAGGDEKNHEYKNMLHKRWKAIYKTINDSLFN